jgi:hypothetical protein
VDLAPESLRPEFLEQHAFVTEDFPLCEISVGTFQAFGLEKQCSLFGILTMLEDCPGIFTLLGR